MDQKKYSRAAKLCLFSAVCAALLYDPDSGRQWIALGIAGLAAVAAASLYFYCHLRRPSDVDSAHRDGGLQQTLLLRRYLGEYVSAAAGLHVTKQHYRALNLLTRNSILSQYDAERESAMSWFKEFEHPDNSLLNEYLLATHHAYLTKRDPYIKHSKSTISELSGFIARSPIESHYPSLVNVKSKSTHRKPRSSGRARWFIAPNSGEHEWKGLVAESRIQ